MFLGIPLPNISPELIITSAILASATALAMQAKAMPGKLLNKIKSRCLYTAKVYQYDELFFMFEEWLYSHHPKVYRDVEAMVGDPQYLQGGKSYNATDEQGIKYLQEGNIVIIKYNGKRLVVNKNKEKLDKIAPSTSVKDRFFRNYTVSGLFARNTIDQLLKEAKKQYEEKRRDVTISVYAPTSYGEWEHVTDLKRKKLDSVVISEFLKKEIVADVDEFLEIKDWYEGLGIPYRRGYCFHGLPGNGKTSLSMAIASHTERDIYSLSVNSLENDTALRRAFTHIKEGSILLIEDIDKAFVGRDAQDHKVSFAAMLNCLDGVLSKPDTVTIITTNHLEKLDPALIRAGRMDRIWEIENPGTSEVSEYLSRFYGTQLTFRVPVPALSMSTIQEICIRNKKDVHAAIRDLLKEYKKHDTAPQNIEPVTVN